jgi:hypothetical protein
MIEIVKVTGVEPLGGHRLRVHFPDGSFGDRDFTTTVAGAGPMLEPLTNPEYFARVFVEMGVLSWPNGFDLDSIQLHREMDAAGELHRSAA